MVGKAGDGLEAVRVAALGKKAAPVDAAIVGIIDQVEFDGSL